MKHSLILIVTCTFITLFGGQFALATDCRQNSSTAIIYQPWLVDAKKNVKTWEATFQKLQDTGIKTILLQWTAYGDVDFAQPHEENNTLNEPLLAKIIQLATQYDMKIIFGLWSDPSWFSTLNNDDQAFEYYLTKVRAKNLQQARKLLELLDDNTILQGWYLPEEIDDKNWETKARQQLLSNHLSLMTQQLSSLSANDTPVMISTFFTGQMQPEKYATMLEDQAIQSQLTWLVQDGTGTKRLTDFQTSQYLKHLRSRGHWQGILELFTPSSNDIGFTSASSQLIESRRTLWCNTTGIHPQFMFSLRYL